MCCSRMCFAWWTTVTVCFVGAQYSGRILFPDDPIFETTKNQTTPSGLRVGPGPSQHRKVFFQWAELPAKSSGKSLQMCKKYGGDSNCHNPPDDIPVLQTSVYNGVKASPIEFPHMALIGFQGRSGLQWKFGGSLISERFVLSAAHGNPLKPTRVRLGDYNIRSTEDEKYKEAKPVEFNIIQVIQHPEYDDVKNYNDITLYKLDRDVKFNDYIKPICLHTEYESPEEFLVSGWGSTEFAGPTSDILLKGTVSLVASKECKQSLNPSLLQTRKSEIKDESMICAANFETGTDTCQGDSGGPLQYNLEHPNCDNMYSQVGITSFGIGCGSDIGPEKYPAVYTRVSHYVPWIESIVWP